MTNEKLNFLLDYLKSERSDHEELPNERLFQGLSDFDIFRSLVNIRPPKPIGEDFLQVQDEVLQALTAKKGITALSSMIPLQKDIYLWQGDITTLAVDGIVNAANSAMMGCFYPCHGCIDNAIHTYAGVQLRLECAELMKRQQHLEPIGSAKITRAYNLPSRYILHTVGPIIYDEVTPEDCRLLASCYNSCLDLAVEQGLQSLGFCCISTGEFRFPNDKAAEIAVETVLAYKKRTKNRIKVVFNVYKTTDYQLYKKLLQTD